MKLYAHLLLAALALTARAASIPEKVLPEELKLDASEVPKGPIEIISTEQELLEQTDAVKDVENNLRVRPVEDIPVKVVVEEVPVLKIDEAEGYEVPQDQLKKIREEIKNPGTPQRQEHETQNPEHHVHAITLKQTLQDTQSLLRQGFQGVSEGISNFVDNNEHISALQNSIQSLQKGFTERIHQLNATISNLINSGSVEVQDNVSEGPVKADLQSVENRLNSLENSFNEGIKKLARGVEALTATKADGENAESSTTVPASNPLQIVSQMMTNFQNTVSENFGNLTQNIQNAFQQSIPAGAQSDEGTTTSRPFGGWPNFSFFNPMQQNDENQNQKPPGSMFQLLGNIPIFGNIINRPGVQSPGNPNEASQESSASTKPSENKEPENKPEPETEKPEKKPEPKPEEQPQKNTGPIRQILENNPFIKGISGVVQRLQHNINNPEKPRETVNKEVKKEEPVKVEPTKTEPEKAEPEKAEPEKAEPEKAEPAKDEPAQVDSEKIEPVKVEAEMTPEKTEQEKGLFLFPYHGGHGGHGGGSGDNNDSRSGLEEEVATKSSPEIVKEQTVPAQEKTE